MKQLHSFFLCSTFQPVIKAASHKRNILAGGKGCFDSVFTHSFCFCFSAWDNPPLPKLTSYPCFSWGPAGMSVGNRQHSSWVMSQTPTPSCSGGIFTPWVTPGRFSHLLPYSTYGVGDVTKPTLQG